MRHRGGVPEPRRPWYRMRGRELAPAETALGGFETMQEQTAAQTTMKVGAVANPEAAHTIPATPAPAIDEALQVLAAHKDAWVALALDERIALLERLTDATVGIADRWVDAALAAKGIARGTPSEGEEWTAGPMVTVRNLALLTRSLREIRDHGSPQLPGPLRTRDNGQVVAPVLPTDGWDKLLLTGFEAEVWLEPGVTVEQCEASQASFYRNPPTSGAVALVLGAGNVSSIPPMDTLYKLFAEGQVVALKMNPVNEYLGPIFEEAFGELVERGFLRVIYGGAKEGAYLTDHTLVDTIHITGSDKTHDAIVYGVGDAGERRKAADDRRIHKPITSELGNVSPIIVVPGPWTPKDLEYQGVNLSSSLTNNAGFNCNATRVIIQHTDWNLRQDLIHSIRRAFAAAEPRQPYYPGAEARHAAFVAAHPDAEQFGPASEGHVPWTFISGLDPQKPNDICFTTEAWCGVTSEVALPADSVADYIDRAVHFANDTCWGTLSAAIIVHPASLEDPEVAAAVDRAVADLRFGSVVVNHWPGIAYGFASTTWGAFPGHTMQSVGSGIGVVHNTYLLEQVQKSVVRGPFRVYPKPVWFNDHRTAAQLGRRMVHFSAAPSVLKLPGVLWAALRG